MPIYVQNDKINTITVRIPDSLYSKVRKLSYENRISINKLILEAVEEYMKGK